MPNASNCSDAVVVGGGVVGLSIAYELACHGVSVTLVERGEPGREASWAGAGIIPPASWYVDHPGMDSLCLAAGPMHQELSQRLREETGIDDQFWRCGAEYQTTSTNSVYVTKTLRRWAGLGVGVESRPNGSSWVGSEAQTRNPRRLKALVAALQQRGGRIVSDAEVVGVEVAGDQRLLAVRTGSTAFSAGVFCFAAGCWTPGLAGRAGSAAPGKPVRGQMLLLRPKRPRLDRIVHRYPHYAVPRRDGRVLVGATVEHAGFDRGCTAAARSELLRAAIEIEPTLGDAQIEAHWAGLRPASADPLPLIGALPARPNTWVAAGHHRAGLQLAPPTAALVSAMMLGLPCTLPSAPFDPARFQPTLAAR